METVTKVLLGIDVLIVTYALHRLYHGIFNVIYFSLKAFFSELLVTGIIAFFIVMIPWAGACRLLNIEYAWSTEGLVVGIVYSVLFLTLCFFIVKKFSKNKNNR